MPKTENPNIITICQFSHSVVCDSLRPMNYSMSGCPVHGIFEARILEWVAITFPGDISNPGIEPGSPAVQADSVPYEQYCLGLPLTLSHLKISLQFSSITQSYLTVTPRTAAHQASLSITNSWSSLKFMSIGLVMPYKHLILCCPLLLPPLIFPRIRIFSNESALHIGWPKYWSFSFNIGPSSEYSGLISFRMDWLDLLAVQGTLKSLLQHHSSKASILQQLHSTGAVKKRYPTSKVKETPVRQ